VNEEVTFSIQVLENNNLLENATINYELGPEFFPDTKADNAVLKNRTLLFSRTGSRTNRMGEKSL
jgi:hypothetical protein